MATTTEIIDRGARSAVLSADESLVYVVSGNDVLVIDIASASVVTTITIGENLRGMSLSEDGAFLLIAGDDTAGAAVFKVDLATATFTTFSLASEDGFRDVEVVDADTALVSGPGSTPYLFNLVSGTFTPLPGGNSENANSVLVESGHLTLMAELGASDGPLHLFDDRTDSIVATGDSRQIGATFTSNSGSQAISEVAGYIVQDAGLFANVYDLNLQFVTRFYNEKADGMVFSSSGEWLYVFELTNGEISRYSVGDWQLSTTFQVPASSATQPNTAGDQLLATSNDKFLVLIDSDRGRMTLVDMTNIVTGTENNDTLTGTSGPDTIQALGGNDRIIVTEGTDTVDGGDGNDTLRLVRDHGSITPANSGAEDYVLTSTQLTGAGGAIDTRFSSIERVEFTSYNLDPVSLDASTFVPSPGQFFGLSAQFIGDNASFIGSAGNDIVSLSGSGNEADGGAGQDYLSVRLGFGTAPIVVATVGGVTTIQQEVSPGVFEISITATNFEFLSNQANQNPFDRPTIDASASALPFTFNDGVIGDTFIGSNFDDQFVSSLTFGGDGLDVYYGGAGADAFRFGSALFRFDDTRIEDLDTDDFIELNPSLTATDVVTAFIGTDPFSGAAGEYRYYHAGGFTFVEIDIDGDTSADATLRISNGEFDLVQFTNVYGVHNLRIDNAIYGTSGNNTLDGTTGPDNLIGGDGNDNYTVDNAGDTVTENENEGLEYVYASVDFTLPDNVERLIMRTGAFNGTGNDLDNWIHASAVGHAVNIYGLGGADNLRGSMFADYIDGGEGNDYIFGDEGANYMIGGAGNDRIIGGSAGDVLLGGDDNDTLIGNGGSDQMDGGAGNDVMNGNAGSDFMYGGDGDDFMYGELGIDYMNGNDGNDYMYGGDDGDFMHGNGGNDKLYGDAGADILDGDAGRDQLYGGDGDDILRGGADQDFLTGGLGADTFGFDEPHMAGVSSGSADTIRDFNQGEGDQIDLSAIDAILGDADDAFTFIGDAAFSQTAGELRFQQFNGYTMVQMDTDGDGATDFAVRLEGLFTMVESDFVL